MEQSPLNNQAVQKVKEHLEKNGAFRSAAAILVFTEPVPTAAAAAVKIGCDVGAIANSLIFEANDQPILILTSGAHKVDIALTANRIGVTELKRAKPEFVKEKTGQVIGGVAPVGHPQPILTYVDEALQNYKEIWAAAGHPNTVFPITFEELVGITNAKIIRVN